MYNTVDIINLGLECLVEKVGIDNTERFVTAVKSEKFDYAVWQKEYFEKVAEREFLSAASVYAKKRP